MFCGTTVYHMVQMGWHGKAAQKCTLSYIPWDPSVPYGTAQGTNRTPKILMGSRWPLVTHRYRAGCTVLAQSPRGMTLTVLAPFGVTYTSIYGFTHSLQSIGFSVPQGSLVCSPKSGNTEKLASSPGSLPLHTFMRVQ